MNLILTVIPKLSYEINRCTKYHFLNNAITIRLVKYSLNIYLYVINDPVFIMAMSMVQMYKYQIVEV